MPKLFRVSKHYLFSKAGEIFFLIYSYLLHKVFCIRSPYRIQRTANIIF